MYLHTLYRFSARPGCANSSRNSTQKKQGHETGGALLGFQDMGRGVDDSIMSYVIFARRCVVLQFHVICNISAMGLFVT